MGKMSEMGRFWEKAIQTEAGACCVAGEVKRELESRLRSAFVGGGDPRVYSRILSAVDSWAWEEMTPEDEQVFNAIVFDKWDALT